jgi:hypothetical protein
MTGANAQKTVEWLGISFFAVSVLRYAVSDFIVSIREAFAKDVTDDDRVERTGGNVHPERLQASEPRRFPDVPGAPSGIQSKNSIRGSSSAQKGNDGSSDKAGQT